MLKSGYCNIDHINRLIKESPNISSLSTIKYILNELKKLNIPTESILLDRMPKTRVHERNYDHTEDTFNIKWPTINRESINIFTDGSLLGGNCGFGIYITEKGFDDELSAPMPGYSTVFQCEVMAIKTAAELMVGTVGKNIQIYIDSQAAILALCGNEVNSKTVFDTIHALDAIGRDNNLKLNWIKAHNGHALNDIADKLARDGSASAGPHTRVPMPDANIKELIDNETIKRWNLGWINQEGHRQTKLFFPEVNLNKAKLLYKYSKSKFSQAVRWITGFNGLAYQNNKINPNEFPNPNCQLCEQLIDETSAHLIAQCPILFWERMDAFKTVDEIEEEQLKYIKIPQLIKFLGNNKVAVMENISEYPLLFIDDYNNQQVHEIIDQIANHETSLSSRDESGTEENSTADTTSTPPPKRRDRRTSTERSGVWTRQGIG